MNKEVARGHTARLFLQPPITRLHCSPLGVAPKPDSTVRLILDLSWTHNGLSVNDGMTNGNGSRSRPKVIYG